MIRCHPVLTLFPYTTLFRSDYGLADDTYAELLKRLDRKPVSSSLRQDILSYYGDLEKHYATKKKSKEWHEVMRELEILKSTRSEEHTSELQSHSDLVCRLLL